MIRTRIRQLENLTYEEWLLLVTALVLLPLIAVALHLTGFRRTHQLMSLFSGKGSPETPRQETPLPNAGQVARMVTVAANYGPYRANCMKKSMLIWWLLKRRAIHTEIRIGICKHPSELQAHAWVEFDGKVLNDRQNIAEQFTPFGSLLFPESIPFV